MACCMSVRHKKGQKGNVCWINVQHTFKEQVCRQIQIVDFMSRVTRRQRKTRASLANIPLRCFKSTTFA
jgi:hypothetical protein